MLAKCWRRQWHPTPVLLPGKSHGWRSPEGHSPSGRWGSDTTEQLHFHFSLSCVGEGNGNPLQCSCLENPRDGGVWWAAIHGVSQSRTRLKWLSSSSQMSLAVFNNLGNKILYSIKSWFLRTFKNFLFAWFLFPLLVSVVLPSLGELLWYKQGAREALK